MWASITVVSASVTNSVLLDKIKWKCKHLLPYYPQIRFLNHSRDLRIRLSKITYNTITFFSSLLSITYQKIYKLQFSALFLLHPFAFCVLFTNITSTAPLINNYSLRYKKINYFVLQTLNRLVLMINSRHVS
jgi:hypothetical protein